MMLLLEFSIRAQAEHHIAVGCYVTIVHKNGVHYKQFALPQGATPEGGSKRNEVLDCCVLAEAAPYARGITNWDYEEKLNLATIPGREQERVRTRLPQYRLNDRGGLGSGWNIYPNELWCERAATRANYRFRLAVR
jgi:hypothetical protein